jgi:hypothetical protein
LRREDICGSKESQIENWSTQSAWSKNGSPTIRLRFARNSNLRRFRADTERLQQTDLLHQNADWGGEPAAEKLTRYLKPAQFTIYAREPIAKLIAAGRMRADPNGTVEVLDAFRNFEPDKELPDVVPPILVYADLLATHDGRDVEAARIYERRIAPTFHPTK